MKTSTHSGFRWVINSGSPDKCKWGSRWGWRKTQQSSETDWLSMYLENWLTFYQWNVETKISRCTIIFCLDFLAETQLLYWLINDDTLCIFKSFCVFDLCHLLPSLSSQSVRRGEECEGEPGAWRSQRWRSAEESQVWCYCLSSQLEKKKGVWQHLWNVHVVEILS